MKKIKKPSLVAQVVRRLAEGIVAGRYGAVHAAGQPVLPPQEELAGEFQVSRAVMREAVSMLLSKRMVEVRPKTGTRVRPMREWSLVNEDVVGWRFAAPPDLDFLRDLLTFRGVIEPDAAALAAEHASAAQIAALRVAFEVLAANRCGTPEFQQGDEQFHALLLAASGNQFFLQMTAIVTAAVSTMNEIALPLDDVTVRAVAEHEKVLLAIEARDPRHAKVAMSQLVHANRDNIRERLEIDIMPQTYT
jgi:DNA-binding FadR family transcriptional regulator